MAHYVLATLNIHDRTRYAEYEAGFIEIFLKYGGKFLVVNESPEALEGEWPWTRTVIIEFSSEEAAKSWFNSEEYQTLAEHRKAASSGHVVMLAGLNP